MKKQFEVTVEAECEALGSSYLSNVVLTVDDDLDTLLPYLFYRKYGKEYNELSWYLEDGAKEFVADVEDKWLHNTLDTYAIFNEPEFFDYIVNQSDDPVLDKALDKIYERVRDDLEDLDEDERKELYEDNVGSVSVDVYYNGNHAHLEVDIPLD